MDSETIQALINFSGVAFTGVVGVVTAVITTNNRIKKERDQNRIDEALREQKRDLKFDQIDRKLDEHNGYAEKFAEMHDIILQQGNDIKWIKEELNGKK